MNLPRTVSRFLEEHLKHPRSHPLLCGVSGGVDSMVLAELLRRCRERFGYRLVLLHYNYRIHDRAGEAERIVRRWCREREVEWCAVHCRDPGSLDGDRRGLEANARRLRYRFFADQVRDRGASGVFLGHQRGDQIEALLLNMGRGSGLYGLQGMRPVSRREEGWAVYRPLLDVPAEAVRDWATRRGIPFLEDPTNRDLERARNRIRHRILPEWERAQPDPRAALHRLTQHARRENDFWEEYLEQRFEDWRWDNEIQVDVPCFRRQPPAAQDRYLHSIPRRLEGHPRGWSRRNFADLKELFAGRSGARLDLPGSYRAVREYDRVAVFRPAPDPPSDPVDASPGERFSWQGVGRVEWTRRTPSGPFPMQERLSIPDREENHWTIRFWQDGDRIRTGSSGGDTERVKLKRIFQRERVPLRARHRWPLLRHGDRVVCVPGLETDPRYRGSKQDPLLGFRPDHPAFHSLAGEVEAGGESEE